MMNRTDETTYFSQWGPPTLLCGMLAALGIVVFLITVFYPNPQRGPAYGMLIIPLIFAILWFIFLNFLRECAILPKTDS